jgi:ubiquinone/menaquinone biosynthesis C-methylase UbiE
MEDQPFTDTGSSAWETLAKVYAESRQVSADKLIESPAQRRLVGGFQGKRVLDVGCGTGDKAR